MLSFTKHASLQEKYLNAIGDSDESMKLKKKYQQDAWDILQQSYSQIGGIKGSGFNSPDDMLKIPMWKMAIRDGKLRAVVMYKDKNGRKSVAIGTDGTPEGKWFVADIFKADLKRSYGEKSKAALGSMMKLVPWPALISFVKKPAEAKSLLKKDVTPLKSVPKSEWPEDAVETLKKYPMLIDYGYLREIAGKPTFKVMFGTPKLSLR